MGDTEIVFLLANAPDDLTIPPRTRPVLDQSPTEEFPRPALTESFVKPPIESVPLSPDSSSGSSGEPKGISPRTNETLATDLKLGLYRLAQSPDRRFEPKLAAPKLELPPQIVDRQFGKLKLETVAAIGRTGIVYSSLNTETGEKLAVKLSSRCVARRRTARTLRPHHADDDRLATREFRATAPSWLAALRLLHHQRIHRRTQRGSTAGQRSRNQTGLASGAAHRAAWHQLCSSRFKTTSYTAT